MENIISVCIPVKNEERTIANTIQSVERQRLPEGKSLEILVCTNGCTDKSEEIVRDLASRDYRNLSLYSTQTSSKPYAWNLLMEKSRGDQVIFTDGDVLFGQGAILNLTSKLEETGKALIAGKGIPYLEDESWFQRKFVAIMASAIEESNSKKHITGQLYGISKPKVKEALLRRGIERMPERIIAEDFWLGCLVGENHWEFSPESTFHYRHSSWGEFHKINSRFLRARKQLSNDPQTTSNISFGNPSQYYINKVLSEPNIKARAKMISRFFIRRAYSVASVLSAARTSVLDNSYWERAESTKKPIPLSVIY